MTTAFTRPAQQAPLSGLPGDNTRPSVLVSAPSRLHFGLLSIGDSLPVNYGGAGLMLAQPQTVVEVASSDRLQVDIRRTAGVSPLILDPSSRLLPLVQTWHRSFGRAAGVEEAFVEELPLSICIHESPPVHMGLGAGTQLALSVGAALCRHFGLELPGPQELAVGMGRGRRSAIGSHGFFRGGFMIDCGLASSERFSELAMQLAFPDDWPVLLILPQLPHGSHAEEERTAFADATGVVEVRECLERIRNELLVPALLARDHPGFAVALHDYNTLSGRQYSAVQPGQFHSPAVGRIVAAVLEAGCPGVIQSSWGPGVAVILPDHSAAVELHARLACESLPALEGAGFILTSADNEGARVVCGLTTTGQRG